METKGGEGKEGRRRRRRRKDGRERRWEKALIIAIKINGIFMAMNTRSLGM